MRNVAVVRFPGSNCDLDALRAAEAAGANALLRLAPRHRPAPGRRRDPARRVQLRRLPPVRGDRPVQPGHAGGAAARRRGRRRARDLQRLPDPLRGPPAARRADAERRAALRLQAGGREGRAERHPVHHRLRRRPAPPAAGGARRRPVPRRRRHAPDAGSRRPCGAALRRGHRRLALPAQPQRLRRPHRRDPGTPRATWSASCRTPSAPPTRPRPRRRARILHLHGCVAPCSPPPRRCSADDHREAQPQRGRILRPAERRAAAEATGEERGEPRSSRSARAIT